MTTARPARSWGRHQVTTACAVLASSTVNPTPSAPCRGCGRGCAACLRRRAALAGFKTCRKRGFAWPDMPGGQPALSRCWSRVCLCLSVSAALRIPPSSQPLRGVVSPPCRSRCALPPAPGRPTGWTACCCALFCTHGTGIRDTNGGRAKPPPSQPDRRWNPLRG